MKCQRWCSELLTEGQPPHAFVGFIVILYLILCTVIDCLLLVIFFQSKYVRLMWSSNIRCLLFEVYFWLFERYTHPLMEKMVIYCNTIVFHSCLVASLGDAHSKTPKNANTSFHSTAYMYGLFSLMLR